MSTSSFFPFNQHHPKFPAALRTVQKSFKARDERDKDILIEQFDNVSYIGMFENGCRCRHYICGEGVPEMRKFFFISCNYLDPEHVIVRTYSKLRDFDWNDQAQINNLNLFRQAAITEACGVTAFDEDGTILKPKWMKSMVTEGADKQKPKKREANPIKKPSDGRIKKGPSFPSFPTQPRSRALTPMPVQSVAQTLQPQSTAHVFQFRPTAPQFQPTLPAYGTNGMQNQALGASIAFPARNEEQSIQGLWRDLHIGPRVPGPGYMSPQLSQGDRHVVSPQHNQQPRMNQFQGQGFGMNQQEPQGCNTFSNQRSGMPYKGNQESYGSALGYPTQNYFPSQTHEHGMVQQQHVQQGYNPLQSYGYVPQYISAQDHARFQPQVHQQPAQQDPPQSQNQCYAMNQQPDQRGFSQSVRQHYKTNQQIQQSLNQAHSQMHNQGFAVHQQHNQQSYNQSTFSDYTQQLPNQYDMSNIAGTDYEQVHDQMTTSMNANSHQQTSRTAPGMVAPLTSMSQQDLAEPFASNGMALK